MAAQQETNKALVGDLLNNALAEKNAQAAAELLTERYIQHSPSVPTGRVGFLQGVPGVKCEVIYNRFSKELDIWRSIGRLE